MDSSLHRHPTLPDSSSAAGAQAVMIPPEASSSRTNDGRQPTSKRRMKKKKQSVVSDNASLDSSSNCSSATSYSQKGIKISRNPKRFRVGPLTSGPRSSGLSDVDAIGLPLGMSIAAVVAQVLEKKSAAGKNMSVDHLCAICGLAVRESLGNIFGDKFDNFVTNFETSFRSTLMTLQSISGSSLNVSEKLQRARSADCSCSVTSNVACGAIFKDSVSPPETKEQESCVSANSIGRQQEAGYQGSTSEASNLLPLCRIGDLTYLSSNGDGPMAFPHRTSIDRQCHTRSEMEESIKMNSTNQQLVLHDKRTEQQLACSSPSNSSSMNQISMLSTIEKSVLEQTRSNDLKTFEIGLIMKKMQLKERQLELNSNANVINRWKLSMGISKASFKSEKFKTELQDMRQVELLKKCLDFLVGGLVIMLFSLAYGTYVFSHQRIIEATEACSPYTESSSWWMPKTMTTFNSGLQLLKCQIQVFSRMLFGALMIAAIAFLLIQRSSSSSHQTMPVTFILLLLGVGCGYAGKFCIDTLGGSGNHWLIYWEALCSLHFLSNIFHSTLYIILNGPVVVAEKVVRSPVFPYWSRKLLFYATLLCLPLLCGFMPFASPWEWFKHFRSQAADMLTYEDD